MVVELSHPIYISCTVYIIKYMLHSYRSRIDPQQQKRKLMILNSAAVLVCMHCKKGITLTVPVLSSELHHSYAV